MRTTVLAAVIALGQGVAAWGACSDGTVEFRDPDGGVKARFSVELADEWPEIQTGLMNRESMSKSAGMLFIYDRPRMVSFWMKNTLIPLDMIFMTEDGVVRKVHENAVPLDETAIPGGNAIKFVLEINGGLSSMLGIVPGTEMRHPAVEDEKAAWPCE